MSEKLVIKNFRVFSKETEFKLSSLTILTGKNSAGKSSVIKALLILSDYLRSNNLLIIDLHGPSFHKHKMLHFQDALPWGSEDKEVSFELSNDVNTFKFTFSVEPGNIIGKIKSLHIFNIALDASFTLNYDGNGHFEVKTSSHFIGQFDNNKDSEASQLTKLNHELIKLQDDWLALIEKIDGDDTERIKKASDLQQNTTEINDRIYLLKSKNEKIEIAYDLTTEQRDGIDFISLMTAVFTVYSKIYISKKNPITNLTDNLNLAVDLASAILNIRISHLGPNRTQQSRLYTRYNTDSEIANVINEYALSQPSTDAKVGDFLQRWMSAQNFDIGDRVEVELIEGEASILHLMRGGQRINSADMGFGVGQVLTILLKIVLFAQKNLHVTAKYLLIEEPEANLHPRLQSLLADMLFDAHKTFGIRFILETHSEYLIRKIMVNVADPEHSMSTRDISILYVTNHHGGASVREIEINSNGTLSENFGEGFFDEASRHTYKLSSLRKKAL